MGRSNTAKAVLGLLLVSSALAPTWALAQQASEAPTLFTTQNWKEDQALWTDPAYYRFNTPAELDGIDNYGVAGDPAEDMPLDQLQSKLPYQTAEEHYQALLDAAGGGTAQTQATLPDWSGYWGGGNNWLRMDGVQASTAVQLFTPEYQEQYVEQMKAEVEGRAWWPAAFCLPEGPSRWWTRGVGVFFQVTTQALTIIHPDLSRANVGIRWIETTGKGHAPAEQQFPQILGESIGFWDGDKLVVHTNQIKRWAYGHGELLHSDSLEIVETYQRDGDTLHATATLYDPVAYVKPLYVESNLAIRDEPPTVPWSFCTLAVGGGLNTYFDEQGYLQERIQGDPLYWDPTDPTPWRTVWNSMPLAAAAPPELVNAN